MPRLRTVSRAAGRRRVRVGMTVTEATAHCAELTASAWDEAIITQAITDVTAALLVASPQVTPVAGAPGLWWAGASGFDAVGGERGLVRALANVATAWHPDARITVADSCVAARAAAWGGGTRARCIIPRGGDAAYLATAPLALVPMDDEVRAALIALGIRTLGALAALTPMDVERRWGDVGLAAWRLARGDDRRRPVLTRVDARRAVTAELPVPVTTLEPVLFLVRAALDRLVTQLVADGRAAATIAVTVQLDSGGTSTREVRMARPVARVAPLFERCRTLLERVTLASPAIGVTVAVVAVAPLSGEQGSLFDTAWRDPAAVDAALDRLRAELGPNTVVRPVARDRHCPERSGAWEEAAPDGAASVTQQPSNTRQPSKSPVARQSLGSPATRQSLESPVARRSLEPPGTHQSPGAHQSPTAHQSPIARRFLESPEAIDVECSGDRPVALRWRARRIPIDRAIGPERLAGDWWDDAYCRDYWRCDGADTTFVVYVDYTRGAQWYVQGWHD